MERIMTQHIHIDLLLPSDVIDSKEYEKFQQEMNQLIGRNIDEKVKYELNTIVHEFELYLKENYPFDETRCRIKGEFGYYETTWTIKQLCKIYNKYCPERYKEKKHYTKREINNMLFDLKLEDVIGGYKPVAVPYCGFNEDIFTRELSVRQRYFI